MTASACTPGSAPGPALGNEYGKPLIFTFTVPSSTSRSYVFTRHRLISQVNGMQGTRLTARKCIVQRA